MSFERWDRMNVQPPAASTPPEVRTGDAHPLSGKRVEIIGNGFSGVEGTVCQIGVQFEANRVFSGGSVAAPAVHSPFNVMLLGLLPDTTYEYRAYVDTDAGQYVGEIRQFTLPAE